MSDRPNAEKDDLVSAFQPFGVDEQDVIYDPESIATALDDIRRVLPDHAIVLPDNLLELNKISKDLNSLYSKYSRLRPHKKISRSDFYSKSAQLLLDRYGLKGLITVNKLHDLQDIFDFLYDLNTLFKNLLVGLNRGSLVKAIIERCKTEEEKRDFLIAILRAFGYPDDIIQFDEIQNRQDRLSIPTSPVDGQTYDKRISGENAPEFIQRVYGNWLTGEFTRADLRKIDPQAEMGLRNWEKKNGRAPLNLPTKKERNDRLLAESNFEGKPETVKLYDALRARKRRGRQNTP